MNNEVQGTVTLNVLQMTNLNVKEFLTKFHEDNIIDTKVLLTLSDGSVHTFHVCEVIRAIITSFMINDEECVPTENEKASKPVNLLTKISV